MLFALIGALLMLTTDLPMGSAPAPVVLPHFPDRVHAFVWRNWPLVPVERMAQVLQAKPQEVRQMGAAMGLPPAPKLSAAFQRRSALTVIRRNWHLLPYDQLLTLLDWTPEQLAFTLREDDFLYIKLGSLKPKCEPLRYQPPDAATKEREEEVASLVREYFPSRPELPTEPLFAFVEQLSEPRREGNHGEHGGHGGKPSNHGGYGEHGEKLRAGSKDVQRLSPRFCYSYFALYGDPLMEKDCDPYPEGYLARLAATGVEGVWLQAVLYKLAPFPWDTKLSADYEKRLAGLKRLVARAKRHGIGVYLYLNEPRAMPLSFFEQHGDLKGVAEGDYATICTSHPEVQRYITEAVATICRAVPDLAGFFTITASENLTNCWSHHTGKNCARCSKRTPAEVIAEVNVLVKLGIEQAEAKGERGKAKGNATQLFAWDWGWGDDWAVDAVKRLPDGVALQSVSEWSLPIVRGGVATEVGEYSISAIGPGPRARRYWEAARQQGLKTLAKIQAGNTWELSATPYIPAVENVAQHIANLRKENLNGLMLGWTLGGYPSPNLEVVAEMAQDAAVTPEQAMERVAVRRFGSALGTAVVEAWRGFSAAFREFPYHIGVVYSAPQQLGPANLLWAEPTRYAATMVGFPYDDLDTWRAVYPPDIFASQLEKVADGFERSLNRLSEQLQKAQSVVSEGHVAAGHPAKKSISSRDVSSQAASHPETKSISSHSDALRKEMDVAEAAGIHFRSVANQTRFVMARRALTSAKTRSEAVSCLDTLERVLKAESELARRLYVIQSRDSRIGFEASNQYYYVPVDLMEKALNVQDLLTHWLPAERAKWTQ